MSKESKPKKTRSTKSHTAELEAKIAELEARLANLSSQVQPGAARPAQTREAPKPQARTETKPAPRPAASGPSRGTLPAGFKPAPKPASAPEHEAELPSAGPAPPGEVSPAYAAISSSGYTGNRYYATRRRLAYHPPDKQFRGSQVSTTTAPPPQPAPEREPEARVSQTRGTLPAGTKAPEKKSLWRSKGAEYENYALEETKRAPPPPEQGRSAPPPPPRPQPPSPSRGTLPAGFKPAPKPEPKPEVTKAETPEAAGEVAPAYATISSSGYTGNKYYATRKRMSYHPPNKQFTGSASTTAPPTPEPPKPKTIRGTLPAGFKA